MVENFAATSPQFAVHQNFQDLVTHFLPSSCSDEKKKQFVSYSMRLLSKRSETSHNSNADFDHIKQLLIKKGKLLFPKTQCDTVQQNYKEGLNTVPAMGRKGPIARAVTVGEEI